MFSSDQRGNFLAILLAEKIYLVQPLCFIRYYQGNDGQLNKAM